MSVMRAEGSVVGVMGVEAWVVAVMGLGDVMSVMGVKGWVVSVMGAGRAGCWR